MASIIGNVKLGKNVVLEDTTTIYGPVTIGNNCYIGKNVIIGYPKLSNKKSMISKGKIKDGGRETTIGNGVMIYSNATVYEDVKMGNNVKIFHNALIRENVKIGNNCMIGTNSVLDGYLQIGDNTLIHSGAYICANSRIGNQVAIYPGAHLANEKKTYSRVGIEFDISQDKYVGPVIKDFAVIGMNATIGAGIVIGEECFIGSASMVTKNTEPRSVYAGNPAGRIGDWRNPARELLKK